MSTSTTELELCLQGMEQRGVDAMILGREAGARAVSGVGRLWLTGTRPFAPSCVVVRESGAVHLLANSNDGYEDFPADHLYSISWNPERMLGALQAIDGLAQARTVGVDGMSPGIHQLLRGLLPDATFVDAGPILADLWRVDSPEKLTAVREAAHVARAGLIAMAEGLRDGVRARHLRGICAETFAEHGVTTPAFEAVAAPIDGGASTWLPPERLMGSGEHVALRAGALRNGWEASLARTFVIADLPIEQPPPDDWNEALALCRPGVPVGKLRDLDTVVYGAGRGVEPYDDDLELEVGMVFAVELHQGNRLHQDVLHLTENGPEVLTGG